VKKRYLQDICILSQDQVEDGMPVWANLVGRTTPFISSDELAGGGVYACFWDDALIYIGSYVGPEGNPFGGYVADRIYKHVLGFTLRAKKLGFNKRPLQSIIANLNHPIARDLEAARKINDRLEKGSIQATYRKAYFASVHWDELRNATPEILTERFTFAYRRLTPPSSGMLPKRAVTDKVIPLEKALIRHFEPICNSDYRAGMDGPPVGLAEVSEVFEQAFARSLPPLASAKVDSISDKGEQVHEDFERDTILPPDPRWQEYVINNGELRAKAVEEGSRKARVLLRRPSPGRVHCRASPRRLSALGIDASPIDDSQMSSSVAVDFDAEAEELAALLRKILDACLAELDHKENPPAA
jgi:hypothetical protein